MSTNKKTRADSVLGTLTVDRQEQIAEHARTHALVETVAWLKADGVKISVGSLSSWLSDWRLSAIFRHSESKAVQFRDWLAKATPALSAEELDQRAALMFQFQAVESGDAETWLAIASARQKGQIEKAKLDQRERQLQLDTDKFQFDAVKAAIKHAAEIKTISANSKISSAEKVNQIRQKLFGTLPQTPVT